MTDQCKEKDPDDGLTRKQRRRRRRAKKAFKIIFEVGQVILSVLRSK